jgi:hypothetical protein
MRRTAVLLSLALVNASAQAAFALDHCVARLDKKSGELLVSASSVVGTPFWGGGDPDSPVNPFPDLASCQKGSKLKKCRIGDAGTYSAKRLPSSCTLSLADDAQSCSVHIQGCAATSFLAARIAEVGMMGNWQLSRSFGALSASRLSAGRFEVSFDRAIDECFPSVTVQTGGGGAAACSHCGTTDHDVEVRTYDPTGASIDSTFYLVMHCP